DFYELLDWHISPPISTLEKYIHQLNQSVDVIVLLSHLGINEDREIARRFPDIDVIIGGHTHHLLRTGEKVNNTLITAAGKHCSFVGEVILTWDHNLKKLINKEAHTTEITHLAKDLATEQQLIELSKQAAQHLARTIIHLEETIEEKWFTHSEIIQKLTDTMKSWTNADCAMLNSGLLLEHLPAGDITYVNVHDICSHHINQCVF